MKGITMSRKGDKKTRKSAVSLYRSGMSYREVASSLDVHHETIRRWVMAEEDVERTSVALAEISEVRTAAEGAGFEFDESGLVNAPEFPRWDRKAKTPKNDLSGMEYDEDEEEPIEDLISRRKDRFSAIEKQKIRRHIRHIKINIPGPIAITHFGDPHIDDDSCHWPKLMMAIKTVSRTPGMFGGNIGDNINNWVGRLQRLWAHQSTTIDDAVRLAQWLLESVPWLYVVLGNHDKWNQGSQLIKYLTKGAKIAALVENTAKLELTFPEGDPIRIVAKHDFRGSSVWNRAHGPLKESKLDPWGQIYVAGHKHVWVSHHEEGSDGTPRWSIRVRGFKWYDEYAETLGFYQHEHGEVCTTILDPTHRSPMERIRVVWDIEEAADMLRYLRRRAGVD
jgi:transposase-like protein